MTTEVTAYIGIGSNLADPVAQIQTARRDINALENVKELCFSDLYASPPMGPQDQPDYVNAVMAISTSIPPMDLLHLLQSVENEHGRVRGRRWGERTLDLDILLYGDVQMQIEALTLPHPGISQRAFVLLPLSDCAPDLEIPGQGKLSALFANCPLNGIQKLESA